MAGLGFDVLHVLIQKKKSESVMFSWVLRTGDVETFCLSGFGGISKLYQHLEMAEPDTNTRSMETSFLI